jgi:hypothetical protein
MVWDSARGRVYYIGSDHNPTPAVPRFIQYDETANAWTTKPSPTWFPGISGTAMHGYHHIAIDSGGHRLFYRQYGASNTFVRICDLRTIDAGSPTWTQSSNHSSVMSYGGANGVDFAPWLGRAGSVLVYGNPGSGNQGRLIALDTYANTWSTLEASAFTTGDIHQQLEVSVRKRCAIMGGGNGSPPQAIHKYGYDGTKTFDISTASPRGGIVGVVNALISSDPVTGNFLIMWAPNSFWEFDPADNSWTQLATAPLGPDPTTWGACCPCPTHGVTLWATADGSGNHEFWVYKHSAKYANP